MKILILLSILSTTVFAEKPAAFSRSSFSLGGGPPQSQFITLRQGARSSSSTASKGSSSASSSRSSASFVTQDGRTVSFSDLTNADLKGLNLRLIAGEDADGSSANKLLTLGESSTVNLEGDGNQRVRIIRLQGQPRTQIIRKIVQLPEERVIQISQPQILELLRGTASTGGFQAFDSSQFQLSQADQAAFAASASRQGGNQESIRLVSVDDAAGQGSVSGSQAFGVGGSGALGAVGSGGSGGSSSQTFILGSIGGGQDDGQIGLGSRGTSQTFGLGTGGTSTQTFTLGDSGFTVGGGEATFGGPGGDDGGSSGSLIFGGGGGDDRGSSGSLIFGGSLGGRPGGAGSGNKGDAGDSDSDSGEVRTGYSAPTKAKGEMPYAFNYEVRDDYTKVFQSRNEEQDGKEMKGEYRVVDPDGYLRIVRYGDRGDGFYANVERIPQAVFSSESQERYGVVRARPSGSYSSPISILGSNEE